MCAAENQAVTKAELTEVLFDELGLNKREAKELVEQFFEEIIAARQVVGVRKFRIT